MTAKIYWGVCGLREGWWLEYANGVTQAVLGPSICVSSAGGANEAVRSVRDWGYEGPINIVPVEHKDVSGRFCSCSDPGT